MSVYILATDFCKSEFKIAKTCLAFYKCLNIKVICTCVNFSKNVYPSPSMLYFLYQIHYSSFHMIRKVQKRWRRRMKIGNKNYRTKIILFHLITVQFYTMYTFKFKTYFFSTEWTQTFFKYVSRFLKKC